MKIFVPWSGGLDSTYLLQKLSSDGHDVSAGYIEFSNNASKVVREKKAISEIIETGFLKKHKVLYEREIATINLSLANKRMSLYQPQVWLTSLMYHVDPTCNDAIALGYVLNDDAISFIDDIKRVWRAMNVFSYAPLPKLIFPLTKISKKAIWDRIDPEIKDLVTWCENIGEKDNCGHCSSCRRAQFSKLYRPKDIRDDVPEGAVDDCG